MTLENRVEKLERQSGGDGIRVIEKFEDESYEAACGRAGVPEEFDGLTVILRRFGFGKD